MNVLKITVDNFFKLFPPHTRNIFMNGEVICNLGKEIVCDICNRDANHVDELVICVVMEEGQICEVLCEKCGVDVNSGVTPLLVELRLDDGSDETK